MTNFILFFYFNVNATEGTLGNAYGTDSSILCCNGTQQSMQEWRFLIRLLNRPTRPPA